MALNKADKNDDARGDKPSKMAKEGLKFPLGSKHWENKVEDTMVADLRYATEFGAPEELKEQVDGLAKYVRSHKAKH